MKFLKLDIDKIEVFIHRKSTTLLLILPVLKRHNHPSYLFRDVYKIIPTKENYLALGMDLGSSCLKWCRLGILSHGPQVALWHFWESISLGPKFTLLDFPARVTCSLTCWYCIDYLSCAKNVQSASNSKWVGCGAPWHCIKYGGNR